VTFAKIELAFGNVENSTNFGENFIDSCAVNWSSLHRKLSIGVKDSNYENNVPKFVDLTQKRVDAYCSEKMHGVKPDQFQFCN